MWKLKSKETQCLSPLNHLVLGINEFINGLTAGNRQICEDHKGSLRLHPLLCPLSDFLPAHSYLLLSSSPHIKVSQSSDLRPLCLLCT